jgi:N-methylhydantoinase A/oxoprolinase/acetone carboxylase beta subunit
MSAFLGIDTGGTYTDAVLFDPNRGLLSQAKALTRRHDLTLGIRESVARALHGRSSAEVELVSLSTTLATNAVVEGQGSPICLVLIGHPGDALEQCGLGEALGADPVVFVRGGHDVSGQEREPLDLGAAAAAATRFAGSVAAFAVSGYFSVRNPSHENEVRRLLREQTGMPVTCGHELTSNLHASRRALTAALNARLVPFLSELIRAVQGILREQAVEAPLMVVKGDGSLVDCRFALEYPIETILSGPAASVVGSLYLSGRQDACVVDMGGTTTDIAFVRGGQPVINREGATVGGWQTMVEAVRVHTTGLGGDSELRWEPDGAPTLGPRRHIPLSLLASDHRGVEGELERQLRRGVQEHDGLFVVGQRACGEQEGGLGELQRAILRRLEAGPVALDLLYAEAPSSYLLGLELRRLTERGYVGVSGFTPSDACHVLGLQSGWSVRAAELGARIAARTQARLRRRGSRPPGPGARAAAVVEATAEAAAESLCREVVAAVTLQSGRAIVSALLAESCGLDLEQNLPVREVFVDRAVLPAEGGALAVELRLNEPLVAIGAPAATYYPEVSRRLHTELCVPAQAPVANAIGAVVGSVTQSVRVLISSQDSGAVYRVHLADGVRDFVDLEEAAQFAAAEAEREARALADKAGAASAQVTVQRRDHTAVAAGDEFFLESVVVARANGRPHLAHSALRPA